MGEGHPSVMTYGFDFFCICCDGLAEKNKMQLFNMAGAIGLSFADEKQRKQMLRELS